MLSDTDVADAFDALGAVFRIFPPIYPMSSYSSLHTDTSHQTLLQNSPEPDSTPLHSIYAALIRPLSSCIFLCPHHHHSHPRSDQHVSSCLDCRHNPSSQRSDYRPFRFNRLHGINDSCASTLSPLIQAHFDRAATMYRTARYQHRPESVHPSYGLLYDFTVQPVENNNLTAHQSSPEDGNKTRDDNPSRLIHNGDISSVPHSAEIGVTLRRSQTFNNVDQDRVQRPNLLSSMPRYSAVSQLQGSSSACAPPVVSSSSPPLPLDHPVPINKSAFADINNGTRCDDYDNSPQVYTSSMPFFPQTAHSASGLPPSEELYLLRHMIRAMDSGKARFDISIAAPTNGDGDEESIVPDCPTPDPDHLSRSTLSRVEPPLREDQISLSARHDCVRKPPDNFEQSWTKPSSRRRYHRRFAPVAQFDGFSRRVMHSALASSTPPGSERDLLRSMTESLPERRKMSFGRFRRRMNIDDVRSV